MLREFEKMMLRAVLLMALVGLASGIACMPNACDLVKCAPVDPAACNGVVSEHGGFCGCCPECIEVLGEGDNCWAMFLFGIPQGLECGPGLYCDPRTSTCTPNSKRILVL